MILEQNVDNGSPQQVIENQMVSVEVQTDIQDLRCEFVMANPNLIVIQNKRSLGDNRPLSFQPPPIYYP